MQVRTAVPVALALARERLATASHALHLELQARRQHEATQRKLQQSAGLRRTAAAPPASRTVLGGGASSPLKPSSSRAASPLKGVARFGAEVAPSSTPSATPCSGQCSPSRQPPTEVAVRVEGSFKKRRPSSDSFTSRPEIARRALAAPSLDTPSTSKGTVAGVLVVLTPRSGGGSAAAAEAPPLSSTYTARWDGGFGGFGNGFVGWDGGSFSAAVPAEGGEACGARREAMRRSTKHAAVGEVAALSRVLELMPCETERIASTWLKRTVDELLRHYAATQAEAEAAAEAMTAELATREAAKQAMRDAAKASLRRAVGKIGFLAVATKKENELAAAIAAGGGGSGGAGDGGKVVAVPAPPASPAAAGGGGGGGGGIDMVLVDAGVPGRCEAERQWELKHVHMALATAAAAMHAAAGCGPLDPKLSRTWGAVQASVRLQPQAWLAEASEPLGIEQLLAAARLLGLRSSGEQAEWPLLWLGLELLRAPLPLGWKALAPASHTALPTYLPVEEESASVRLTSRRAAAIAAQHAGAAADAAPAAAPGAADVATAPARAAPAPAPAAAPAAAAAPPGSHPLLGPLTAEVGIMRRRLRLRWRMYRPLEPVWLVASASAGDEAAMSAVAGVYVDLRSGARWHAFPAHLLPPRPEDAPPAALLGSQGGFAAVVMAAREEAAAAVRKVALEARRAEIATEAAAAAAATRVVRREALRVRPRCAVELMHAARALRIDLIAQPELAFLAELALCSALPAGWELVHPTSTGVPVRYKHTISGVVQSMHPLEACAARFRAAA